MAHVTNTVTKSFTNPGLKKKKHDVCIFVTHADRTSKFLAHEEVLVSGSAWFKNELRYKDAACDGLMHIHLKHFDPGTVETALRFMYGDCICQMWSNIPGLVQRARRFAFASYIRHKQFLKCISRRELEYIYKDTGSDSLDHKYLFKSWRNNLSAEDEEAMGRKSSRLREAVDMLRTVQEDDFEPWCLQESLVMWIKQLGSTDPYVKLLRKAAKSNELLSLMKKGEDESMLAATLLFIAASAKNK